MYGINKWLEKVKKAYAKLFKKALAPKKQTTKRTPLARMNCSVKLDA